MNAQPISTHEKDGEVGHRSSVPQLALYLSLTILRKIKRYILTNFLGGNLDFIFLHPPLEQQLHAVLQHLLIFPRQASIATGN